MIWHCLFDLCAPSCSAGCDVAPDMRSVVPECNMEYTILQEETRNFSASWDSTGTEDDLNLAFEYKRYKDDVLYLYMYYIYMDS